MCFILLCFFGFLLSKFHLTTQHEMFSHSNGQTRIKGSLLQMKTIRKHCAHVQPHLLLLSVFQMIVGIKKKGVRAVNSLQPDRLDDQFYLKNDLCFFLATLISRLTASKGPSNASLFFPPYS